MKSADAGANPSWKVMTLNRPPGCIQAWHAEMRNQTMVCILQLEAGDLHMLCYQLMGDPKPTVKRFPTIQMA